MATNKPDRTVHDAMESHRERTRGQRVADKYEQTLSYIPDEIEPYVGPSPGSLGYTTDSYISINKTNYDDRVQSGATVLITFGSGGGRGYAEATVRSDTDAKNDDVTVEIGGHQTTVKGWQIKGVLDA